MRRRDFIKLVGSATAAWPLAAHAQQAERVRRIGVLLPFAVNDKEAQARNGVFEQSLQQLGWTIGRDLQIDYRWPGGDATSIRRDAAELVALSPDVLVAAGSSTTGPLQQATQTIPIVFANLADPVGWLRPKPSAAGGQCHWFHHLRIQHEREMGGIAQANCAPRDACGGHSRSRYGGGHRSVQCNPIGGTVAWR